MLILALFYLIYLLAWRIYDDKDQVYKITSIITILGIINVPITKYSVDWWNTLHQPASISILSKTSIHSSMLILALFYAMYLIVWRIYDKEEKVYKISTFITILGIINAVSYTHLTLPTSG